MYVGPDAFLMRMVRFMARPSAWSSVWISSSVKLGSTPRMTAESMGDARGGRGVLKDGEGERVRTCVFSPNLVNPILLRIVVRKSGLRDLRIMPFLVRVSCVTSVLGKY